MIKAISSLEKKALSANIKDYAKFLNKTLVASRQQAFDMFCDSNLQSNVTPGF